MERGKLLYWTDVGLGVSFLIAFITGLVKFRLLIPYFKWLYELISPKQMMIIHDWSGILIGVFVLIHLILHRKWITAMTREIFK